VENIDDEHIIRQYQQGDQSAFRKLFERYFRYVYSVFVLKGVSREEAEDFTQDLFLKLTNTLLTFKGKSRFKTYLDRAIHHRLIDFYRHKSIQALIIRHTLVDPGEDSISPHVLRLHSTDPIPLEEIEKNEFRENLNHCMERIKNLACRSVLSLWIDGFKPKQIARLLKLPQGTINSHFSRGRSFLINCLKKIYE